MEHIKKIDTYGMIQNGIDHSGLRKNTEMDVTGGFQWRENNGSMQKFVGKRNVFPASAGVIPAVRSGTHRTEVFSRANVFSQQKGYHAVNAASSSADTPCCAID